MKKYRHRLASLRPLCLFVVTTLRKQEIIINIQSTTITNRNQQENKKSLNLRQIRSNDDNSKPWNKVNPWPKSLAPAGLIYAMTHERSKALNIILVYHKRHKGNIYAMRKTLAKAAGIGLSTFDEAVKFLIKHGFIAVKNNGANKSCWYKVSKWFQLQDVQWKLSKKLPIIYFSLLAIGSINSDGGQARSINVFNFMNIKEQQSSYCTMTMSKKESMRILDTIQKACNFGSYELNELAKYDEKVLAKAYNSLKRLRSVKNPFRYLNIACDKIKQEAVVAPKKAAASSKDSGIYTEHKVTVAEISKEQQELNKEQGKFIADCLAAGHSFATIREMMNDRYKTQPIENRSANCNVVDVLDISKTSINGKLGDSLNNDNSLITDYLFDADSNFEEVLD